MKYADMLHLLNKPFSKHQSQGNQSGMSLIEIIIVVALMGTLMAIVITNLTGKQQSAMEDATRLAQSQLETNLQMYKVHNYSYPTTDQGLDALITQPSAAKKWRGPYTEEKKLNDPWGNKFTYESDGKTVKITSAGADGEMGTPDDIVYPEESEPQGSAGTGN